MSFSFQLCRSHVLQINVRTRTFVVLKLTYFMKIDITWTLIVITSWNFHSSFITHHPTLLGTLYIIIMFGLWQMVFFLAGRNDPKIWAIKRFSIFLKLLKLPLRDFCYTLYFNITMGKGQAVLIKEIPLRKASMDEVK